MLERWLSKVIGLLVFVFLGLSLVTACKAIQTKAKRFIDKWPRMRPGDLVYHADTHTLLFAERYFPAQHHRLLLMG